MNFNDALSCVELVIESDAVPLLIGDSGIGKTALINKIGRKNHYHIINIDGNMLKEGEIGGLPTIENYIVNINGEEVNMKRTVYAVHVKLQEIQQVLLEKPQKTILLFIDEINRCEHSVQQELMNIILNREINGYSLPDQVKVVAAMNPPSKYEKYSQSEYQVVDMDPAQENRFVWIDMEIDVKNWISWGMEGEIKNIHEDILNFISSFPDYLHTPKSTEMIKATPRSWQRVSDSYMIYLKKKNEIPERIFYNVVKGNIGPTIAGEFISFLKNNKRSLIKLEEIFTGETLQPEIIERIKGENHSRLYLLSKKVFRYLSSVNEKDNEINIFSELLQYYPSDLKLAVMKELKYEYEENLYQEFLNNPNFVEGYFKSFKF